MAAGAVLHVEHAAIQRLGVTAGRGTAGHQKRKGNVQGTKSRRHDGGDARKQRATMLHGAARTARTALVSCFRKPRPQVSRLSEPSRTGVESRPGTIVGATLAVHGTRRVRCTSRNG